VCVCVRVRVCVCVCVCVCACVRKRDTERKFVCIHMSRANAAHPGVSGTNSPNSALQIICIVHWVAKRPFRISHGYRSDVKSQLYSQFKCIYADICIYT